MQSQSVVVENPTYNRDFYEVKSNSSKSFLYVRMNGNVIGWVENTNQVQVKVASLSAGEELSPLNPDCKNLIVDFCNCNAVESNIPFEVIKRYSGRYLCQNGQIVRGITKLSYQYIEMFRKLKTTIPTSQDGVLAGYLSIIGSIRTGKVKEKYYLSDYSYLVFENGKFK